jgi:hypothetical protein
VVVLLTALYMMTFQRPREISQLKLNFPLWLKLPLTDADLSDTANNLILSWKHSR